MKVYRITIVMLLALAFLPHLVSGQPSILSNQKISKEVRDFFKTKWLKDSLEIERYLAAYTAVCSRSQTDAVPADTMYSKSKTCLRLRAMRDSFDLNWNTMLHSIYSSGEGNFLEVIRQAFDFSRELEKVSPDEYPFMNSDYVAISQVYYTFNDSVRLASTLEKVLSNPVTAFSDPSRIQAGIIMGRYMTALGHRGEAIAFLLGALECEDRVTDRKHYNAMALANLGITNARFRRFDVALPLLEKPLPVLKEAKAYDLIAEVYQASCDIYMAEDIRGKAVDMYDSLSFYNKKRMVDDPLFYYDEEIIRLQYLNYTQGSVSLLQAGTSLITLELRNRLYNPANIIQVAGEVYDKDMALKTSEAAALRSRQYAILVIALVLLSALLVIFRLYRKKKAAYHELVQRNKQWAESDLLEKVITFSQTEPASGEDTVEEDTGTPDKNTDRQKPTKKEIELTDRIHGMMVGEQLYKDSTLTLETLARLLGVNRESVSRSINRTTGKNFTRFLNEYRIKEAVRLLSAARNHTVNFDDLSEQVGFNNRTTFHRAFKQITGLPPNEFKNNG